MYLSYSPLSLSTLLFFIFGFLGCYVATNTSNQAEVGPLGKHVKIPCNNRLSSRNYHHLYSTNMAE
jgi:hypothetical protein